MSRSWMECSIRQPPPACATSARHCDAYAPLNREVLVVAEDRGHRLARASRPARARAGPGRPGARAAPGRSGLGPPESSHGLDQRRGTRPGPFERLLAEHRAPRGDGRVDRRPVGRGRRADPDRVAARGHFGRVGHHLDAAAPTASAKPRARRSCGSCTATIGGVEHAAVDHRLEAQTVGPGDEAGPDEADTQHAGETSGVSQVVDGDCLEGDTDRGGLCRRICAG